ncbi:plasmid recombination protein [Duganella sp. Root1480D1]|uniref:plasmid recombination protein n=1 Tax=Duganella sp. Root1480D1 TaxID=1736471 RepID=UPI0009E7D9F1|nr:plasmid recombination protein [Duganella sp. Root1480D1]
MSSAQILCIKKLTGKSIVLVAAKHNLREIQAELSQGAASSIDPALTDLNYVLRGANLAAEVAADAKRLLECADLPRLRKDAVRALEIVFSLPEGLNIDQAAFFTDAVIWTEATFQVPILSAVVHLDEVAPHCHVLLLPLIGGRMKGSELMGNRTRLRAIQSDFNLEVGKRYGLERYVAAQRPSRSVCKKAIDSAFTILDRNSGLHSFILRVLLAPHLRDPEPLLTALGIPMPSAGTAVSPRSFVSLMTRKVKPEKP